MTHLLNTLPYTLLPSTSSANNISYTCVDKPAVLTLLSNLAPPPVPPNTPLAMHQLLNTYEYNQKVLLATYDAAATLGSPAGKGLLTHSDYATIEKITATLCAEMAQNNDGFIKEGFERLTTMAELYYRRVGGSRVMESNITMLMKTMVLGGKPEERVKAGGASERMMSE